MAPAQGGQGRHPLHGHRGARLLVLGHNFGHGQRFQLELDIGAHRPGQRVHDHVGDSALLGSDPDAPGHRLDGEVEGVGRHAAGMAVLVPGVVVGRRDGRSRQNVVELVEQYGLPGLGQLGRGVGRAPEMGGHAAPALGGQQQVLGATVPALDPRVSRVAAHRMVLEISHVRGQVGAAGHGVEVAARARRLQAQAVVGGIKAADTVEVGPRRTATVVAHAIEDHKLFFVGRHPFQGVPEERLQIALPTTLVVVRDAVREHARTVGRSPPERFCGQGLFLRRGAQEHVRADPRLGEQLGQCGGVAERVDVAADRRHGSEAVGEEALGVKCLANEGLAVGQVAVRFDPPAAHDDEAALGDAAGNVLEQLGVDGLDPFEVGDGITGENKLRVLVHAVEGRTERGPYLVQALLPLPEPHRVDMGVADHVDEAFSASCGHRFPLPR